MSDDLLGSFGLFWALFGLFWASNFEALLDVAVHTKSPMGIPLIFLDIDGVICCNMVGTLEEPKLAQLQRICQHTQAKVVLSTDWRRQPALKKQLKDALSSLSIDVVGATPCRAMFQPIRPQEITAWLKMTSYDVGAWCAIDDRDLVNEIGGHLLQGHFIKTNPASGLTATLADRAIRMLRDDSRSSPSLRQQPASSSPASSSGGVSSRGLLTGGSSEGGATPPAASTPPDLGCAPAASAFACGSIFKALEATASWTSRRADGVTATTSTASAAKSPARDRTVPASFATRRDTQRPAAARPVVSNPRQPAAAYSRASGDRLALGRAPLLAPRGAAGAASQAGATVRGAAFAKVSE